MLKEISKCKKISKCQCKMPMPKESMASMFNFEMGRDEILISI
jgi:hypothetical protein